MRQLRWALLAAVVAIGAVGCLSINKPLLEVHDDAPPVDSKRVPPTTSHEQAREELRKAYAYIDSLEKKNADLAADRDKYKRERDDYKKQLKKHEGG